MAYKIQYSPENACNYPQNVKKYHIKWGRWLGFLLVAVSALWMRANGIPDFLIPGDPAITKAAAEVMVEEIRAGESWNDAVVVFCKEILNGA